MEGEKIDGREIGTIGRGEGKERKKRDRERGKDEGRTGYGRKSKERI